MIKLYLSCAAILLIANFSIAQIQKVELPPVYKIGEVKYMGEFVAEINYTSVNNDTTYTLLFDNAKYKRLTETVRVNFENTNGILDTLFSILNSGFSLEKGKQSTFVLGKDFISVNTEKSMGVKFIKIMVPTKGFFYLRKNQLAELFNKQNNK